MVFVFLLQEHWLTPYNLHKFEDDFSHICALLHQLCVHVETGALYGRPFGGVCVLVKKELQHCTHVLYCSDRYIVVSVGMTVICNVYLPCSGTRDRLCIVDDILTDISDWMQKHVGRLFVIGGDLNVDLDSSNTVSDLINRFVVNNTFIRSDDIFGPSAKRYTYYQDARDVQSTLDYFLVSDKSVVLSYEVIDHGSNLSDHLPISLCIRFSPISPMNVSVRDESDRGDPDVKQLRWDHANLSLYRETTGFYLKVLYAEITELEKWDVVFADSLNYIYDRLVDMLRYAAEVSVPICKKKFFKFWWDHSLDELKQKSITSCDLWKAAGRPRSGQLFSNYRRDKGAYRQAIRSRQKEEKECYTNDLHEALLKNEGSTFWNCWRSKFDKRNRTVTSVNGVTEPATIADNFASYFSRVCSSNSVSGAARLKGEYDRMRSTYSGYCTDSAFCFDAELVENIICEMHRGKAADIDGITVEHLYYCHSLLPCVLANFLNLMISAGKVPVKFGQSYTCLLYTSPSPRD